MDKKQCEQFESFWHRVATGEDYVRTYGACGWSPDCREAEPYHELIAALDAIRPLLRRIAKPRIFWTPVMARGHVPFRADTAHEAIAIFLSPLDNLFGHVGALESAEYQSMKAAANSEGITLQRRNQAKQSLPNGTTPELKKEFEKAVLFEFLWQRHFGELGDALTRPMSKREMARELGWSTSRVWRLLNQEDMQVFYSLYKQAFVDGDSKQLARELGKKRRNGRAFDDFLDIA